MEPMKPMPPMQPMEPMKPMQVERWWPEELGQPASSGGQDGMRYAVFPEKQRLLVEQDGNRTTYDTGTHRIDGVQQGSDGPVFTGQEGAVTLEALKKIG